MGEYGGLRVERLPLINILTMRQTVFGRRSSRWRVMIIERLRRACAQQMGANLDRPLHGRGCAMDSRSTASSRCQPCPKTSGVNHVPRLAVSYLEANFSIDTSVTSYLVTTQVSPAGKVCQPEGSPLGPLEAPARATANASRQHSDPPCPSRCGAPSRSDPVPAGPNLGVGRHDWSYQPRPPQHAGNSSDRRSLAERFGFGLLRGSFIPPKDMATIRESMYVSK
jgi:hypothetical protein